MKIGAYMFATDYNIDIVELATAMEERGFESLFVPEHTHIPSSRLSPWPGGGDAPVLGHEFHHSSLENIDPGVAYAYEVERGHGIDGRHDGVLVHQVLASYAHLRHAAGSQWVTRFVAHVRRQRARGASAQSLPALARAA